VNVNLHQHWNGTRIQHYVKTIIPLRVVVGRSKGHLASKGHGFCNPLSLTSGSPSAFAPFNQISGLSVSDDGDGSTNLPLMFCPGDASHARLRSNERSLVSPDKNSHQVPATGREIRRSAATSTGPAYSRFRLSPGHLYRRSRISNGMDLRLHRWLTQRNSGGQDHSMPPVPLDRRFRK
jgi:hypothetical protein